MMHLTVIGLLGLQYHVVILVIDASNYIVIAVISLAIAVD